MATVYRGTRGRTLLLAGLDLLAAIATAAAILGARTFASDAAIGLGLLALAIYGLFGPVVRSRSRSSLPMARVRGSRGR
jgi:hypothetical protein